MGGGGMGGGMGGGGGGMGGMGGMGRQSGTMPSMMGMMMLSRMIMYFCGDPESWDMRSLMIGMMGGMGGGMGGMGGGMGGMGGGGWVHGRRYAIRSCDSTAFCATRSRTDAKLTDPARQHHGARIAEEALRLPEKDEPLRIAATWPR